MQFFMTYTPDAKTAAAPPSPEHLAKIGQFSEEMTKAGVLVSTGGLLPLSQGAHVKSANGKFTVTDGPFAEAKEMIVGWAVVEVKTKEEAIEMARRFMAIAGDGEGEVRQVMGPGF